ncbi:response regulator [Methylophaga frappieri]|uniref:Response regulator n=1 Tax=Methylophaga frappieri (strain ATCC BAA-2434 / DSM 25690 / JAM7) TaxID=754477 RepID=I1YI51_METFJ|nr:HD domain-containing phosphohydrolase [Methylophaga frappieri]AFJ02594.1 response regulator [Methylophaga frappieri]
MTIDAKQSTELAPYEKARRLNILRKTKKVLIIDDQSTGRTILAKIIQQIGDNIEVTALSNPITALEWLNLNEADLIVTDYRMPDINGIEFIQQVRQQPKYANVPIMMITVVSEKAVRYEALEAGATAFLMRPIDQIECRTSCRNLLQLHEQHLIIEDRANWLERQVELATEQILQREKETIIRLAKAGEYRDEGTGNHVIRMAKYARQIAEAMGCFTMQECEDLEYAAPMHDIGKIGIPDNVLLKPGPLNPEEWEIMKSHSVIGHEILSGSQSKYMQIGAIIALHHHERYDGKGYPNGLKGDAIPLIARVVSVADVYDALVSARPYKKAWSETDALDFLNANAGSHLDPRCVAAFMERYETIQTIKAAYADE